MATLRLVSAPDVYASAGAAMRSRLISPTAARARARRHAKFFGLLELRPDTRVLDVGCGQLGLRTLEPGLAITGVDMLPVPGYPGPFVQADVLQGLPFADDEFDLVYCSSVIEHIPPQQRRAFVDELMRVGRGIYVQTPAWSFPIEPHAVLPFAHWLPTSLRRPYWRFGVQGEWEQISLLRRAELQRLTGTPVHAERFAGLAKSWIALRSPTID